jgi:hypothetical protein
MSNRDRDYGRQDRWDRQDYGSGRGGTEEFYGGRGYENYGERGGGFRGGEGEGYGGQRYGGRGGSDVERSDRDFGGGYGSYGSYGRSWDNPSESGGRQFYGDRMRRDYESYNRGDFGRGDFGRGYERDRERGFGRDRDTSGWGGGGYGLSGGGYGGTYGYSAFGGGTSGLTGGYGGGYGGYGGGYGQESGRESGGRSGYGYGDMYAAGGRGLHVGRGPKGYQRADGRIEEDVNEMLTRDPDVDASDIEVKVQGGEVTLMGEVGSREEKRRAEDLAEQVSGVRDVHNQIKVKRGLMDRLFGSKDDDQERGSDRDRERTERTRGERAGTSATNR